jgi:hypothetical protein
MEANLHLVESSPKYYCVYLKDCSTVRVQATCYTCTDYGTYAFYREDIDTVNKSYLRSSPPAAIYEIPRRDVSSIAEEGLIEMQKKPKKTRTQNKPKKTPSKKIKSVLFKKRAKGN